MIEMMEIFILSVREEEGEDFTFKVSVQITNLISVMYSASSIDGLSCLSMLFPFALCLRNGRG